MLEGRVCYAVARIKKNDKTRFIKRLSHSVFKIKCLCPLTVSSLLINLKKIKQYFCIDREVGIVKKQVIDFKLPISEILNNLIPLKDSNGLHFK